MHLEYEVQDGLAVIRINRPETRNSLTLPQIQTLSAMLTRASQSDARCLLLTGAGASFCAGRDLKDVGESDKTYEIMTTLINPLLQALYAFPVPTVAAVQGPALGLGLGLALSCDIVIAAEDAVFGSPFRDFGGVTDSGGHYFLERGLGRHRAAELIFTGRLINGIEAANLGLVNRAVPAARLLDESSELCRDIASGPTGAFKATKTILATARGFDEVLELEARYMDAALKGPDGREGIRAFKERRRARFIGS